MPLINFKSEDVVLPATQQCLYFLAVALIPGDFETQAVTGQGDLEWRYLALADGAGQPTLLAFTNTQAIMQFTTLGRGFSQQPPSTDIIRADVDLLRRGPCPYAIWLDPAADAVHAALTSGDYQLLADGLETLL